MESLVTERCFLTDEVAPCHALEVTDVGTGLHGRFFISDWAYRVMCGSEDLQAGLMWVGKQQAESAGYTDGGFVQEIITETSAAGITPYILDAVIDGQRGVYLAVLMHVQGGHGFLVRTRIPSPNSLLESAARFFPVVTFPQQMEWTDDVFLPVRIEETKLVEIKIPSLSAALMNQAVLAYGEPNFWLGLCHRETRAGYELIRRWMI